jgi:GTP-binding protein Era
VHAGLAALIGRPGVGKSALFNRLVGEKISIVTPVPLTTRAPARGVQSGADTQVVWIDTPALHAPRHRLGERMVRQAVGAAGQSDVVVVVGDASAGLTTEDGEAVATARASGRPLILAMNKSDRVEAGARPAIGAGTARAAGVSEGFAISASSGEGIEALAHAVLAHLPEGHEFFPPGVVTDLPDAVRVAELVREQAFLWTRQEVPHSLAVEVDELTPREDRDVIYVRAVVHVDREAQRKILIGAGGKMLKRVGQNARPAIEALLGQRCYLDLWVKVTPRWYDREELIVRLYPD